jgi:large subunit ribosomal protein L9
MKVILLKNVPKLGRRLQIMDVADGFAMNSLFPGKMAELATDDAIERADKLRAMEEAEKAVREDLLLKNLKSIEDVTIHVTGKANEQGHLFAGIHKEQLIPLLKEEGKIDIASEYIILDKPLKEVGEHAVEVKVQDKKASFKVVIAAE